MDSYNRRQVSGRGHQSLQSKFCWIIFLFIQVFAIPSLSIPTSSAPGGPARRNLTSISSNLTDATNLDVRPWPEAPFTESIGPGHTGLTFQEISAEAGSQYQLENLKFALKLLETVRFGFTNQFSVIIYVPNSIQPLSRGFTMSIHVKAAGSVMSVAGVLGELLRAFTSVLEGRDFRKLTAVVEASATLEYCRVDIGDPFSPPSEDYDTLFVAIPFKAGLFVEVVQKEPFGWNADLPTILRLRQNIIEGTRLHPSDEPFSRVNGLSDYHTQHRYSFDMEQTLDSCGDGAAFSNKNALDIIQRVFNLFMDYQNEGLRLDILQVQGDQAQVCGTANLLQIPFDLSGQSQVGNETLASSATASLGGAPSAVAVA